MSQFVANEQEAREYAPRYRMLYGIVLFTVTLFFLRLWYLQIINGSELRTFSEQNSIKETKLGAPRGIIYDRNGEILVENLPGFEATISPQYVTDLNAVSIAVGRALNIPAESIYQLVIRSRKINGPFRAVRIKDYLSHDEIWRLSIIKTDFPALSIKNNVRRMYPLKGNGAQLFGYVGEISARQLPILNEKYKDKIKFQQGDIIGKAGLEEILDLQLRGTDGLSVQQVDARGREAAPEEDRPGKGKSRNLLGDLTKVVPATKGNNVILTIDKDIQEATYNAFVGQGKIGGAVAMKTNGEILAWVSGPSYDPNEFSTGISAQLWSKLINDPDRPLRNKVIQDHNSPGSTFKPMMACAALSEKVITPNTYISCPGQLKFGNRVYHDHKKGGEGNITVVTAIEKSSNVFFYKMGIALGIDKIFPYLDGFGIGHKTGVELPGERSGLMPSAAWKKETIGEEWQLGENLSVAIGQGFVLTTPLQMAVAYNAIGTYGKVVKPFVVHRVLTPDNKIIEEYQPQVVRDLLDGTHPDLHLSKEVFDTVREGMRRVVNGEGGTARVSAHLPFVELAGKTGTSQVMSFSADQIYAKCENRPKHQRHHGWFIGYAPADNPEIAFGILSEHACHGAASAPVAREIVRAYVAKYHPEWLTREPIKIKRSNPGPDAPMEGE